MAEEARPVVILGVGNRLRGDDAIGCLVCDELGKDRIQGFKDSRIQGPETEERRQVPHTGILESSIPRPLIFDCGSTPENYVQPIADRRPARILVVDCCDFGEEAGEFRLFSRQELEDLSYGLLSTHTLPLSLTVELLSVETGATIELLGIQPERIEFGEEVSEPVQRALPAVAEFVRNWARSSQPGA